MIAKFDLNQVSFGGTKRTFCCQLWSSLLAGLATFFCLTAYLPTCTQQSNKWIQKDQLRLLNSSHFGHRDRWQTWSKMLWSRAQTPGFDSPVLPLKTQSCKIWPPFVFNNPKSRSFLSLSTAFCLAIRRSELIEQTNMTVKITLIKVRPKKCTGLESKKSPS